jgi:hypothetical protein
VVRVDPGLRRDDGSRRIDVPTVEAAREGCSIESLHRLDLPFMACGLGW